MARSKKPTSPAKCSDAQQKDFVTRAQKGELTPDEAIDFREEYDRAIRKQAVSEAEAKNPGDPTLRTFAEPAERHASASATVSGMLATVDNLWRDGARKRKSRRRATNNAAAARARKGLSTADAVMKTWDELARSGVPRYARASTIAGRLRISATHVRRLIRKGKKTNPT